MSRSSPSTPASCATTRSTRRAPCSSKRIDPTLREWAAQTVVGYLVEATLNWLEFGDPVRDDEFIDLATAAVRVAISAWSR